MELQVIGGSAVTVADATFAVEFNEGLVHQVVTSYMAGARQGSKAQKNRAAVRGGGIKPWRQKGTGRARAGTIRSPIWVGGGRAFAAKPRDYSQKVNKKMFRKAMQVILSELARQERLHVVAELTLSAPKTRELAAKLTELNVTRTLIVLGAEDPNVMLAARNLPNTAVTTAAHLDPASLVAFDSVVITVDALKLVEEKLS